MGRYGLSFPFLVGAERLMTGREDFNISMLLEELKQSDSEYILSFCNDLDEYIVGVHKKEYPYVGQLERFGGLLINTNTLDELLSFEQLDNFINELYSSYVAENNFSKNVDSGQWQYFSVEDVDIIEVAKTK